MAKSPRVEITYCTQCRWLMRAAWMAQELLVTFETELGEAALVPGTGGVFEERVDGETVWSRQAGGRFPDIKELEQRVRARVAPGRGAGHGEGKPGTVYSLFAKYCILSPVFAKYCMLSPVF